MFENPNTGKKPIWQPGVGSETPQKHFLNSVIFTGSKRFPVPAGGSFVTDQDEKMSEGSQSL